MRKAQLEQDYENALAQVMLEEAAKLQQEKRKGEAAEGGFIFSQKEERSFWER